MNKLKRSHIFYVLKEKTPSPTTELIYKTPFELLISVILSAQAPDISVNKATKRMRKRKYRGQGRPYRYTSNTSMWGL